MRRFLWFLAYVLLIIGLMGCAGLKKLTRPKTQPQPSVGTAAPIAPYSGPKARLAVADFDVQTVKATREIDSGLREMLITALINSHRFSVVERQPPVATQDEELSASGAAQSGAPERKKNITADLMITVAVAEFESQASGGSAGVGGGGGGGSGILGGLMGAVLNKAHMALDIRIVDTSTSAVLAASRVQGQASDIAPGSRRGFFGSWGLGAGLSSYADTPMEKAIRICIIEAVRYISQTIPPSYYKY